MKTLTVNEFFAYSSPWEDKEYNAKLCGNARRSEGWISIIDMTYSLVIEKANGMTFHGHIINTRTGEKVNIKKYGIVSIISEANKIIQTL